MLGEIYVSLMKITTEVGVVLLGVVMFGIVFEKRNVMSEIWFP